MVRDLVYVRAPSRRLRPFVASLGYYACARLPGARETRVPDGDTSLVINLAADRTTYFDGPGLDVAQAHHCGAAALVGPYDHPVALNAAEQASMVLVAFRLGGARPFFGVDGDGLAHPLIELGDLWGRDGTTVAERLAAAPTPAAVLDGVEAALLAQLAHAVHPPALDPVVTRAAAGLDRGLPVAAVGDRLGVSPRLLRRRFAAHVGLPPKRWARLRRTQRLLAALSEADGPVDWAGAAATFGFSDQAHLIQEVRAFTGRTPLAYRPRSVVARNHIPW